MPFLTSLNNLLQDAYVIYEEVVYYFETQNKIFYLGEEVQYRLRQEKFLPKVWAKKTVHEKKKKKKVIEREAVTF